MVLYHIFYIIKYKTIIMFNFKYNGYLKIIIILITILLFFVIIESSFALDNNSVVLSNDNYDDLNDDNYDVGIIEKEIPKKIIIKAPKVTKKYKKSGKFKITVKTKSDKKAVKKLKLKVKLKTKNKYKIYALKTNNHGVAYLKTNKLNYGTYKVSIASYNSKFIGKAKSSIIIKKPVVKKKPKKSHSGGGYYVGSVNSDKFHYPNCSAAKRIKSYNRITFSSRSQAINFGYSSCKICHA